jgi:hypothetical protein
MNKILAQKHQYKSDQEYIAHLETLVAHNQEFIDKLTLGLANIDNEDNVDEKWIIEKLGILDNNDISLLRAYISDDEDIVAYFDTLVKNI